jgi:hypothetical protein
MNQYESFRIKYTPMKTKNIKYTFLIAGMLMLSLVACKKTLEEQSKSFVTPAQFYNNEGQALAAVNGCYTPLTSIYTANFMIANEATTDLAFLNSSQLDAKFEISPANPGMGQSLWQQCYKGVMYCNSTIAGIDRSEKIPDERKKAIAAEAITLRALYYYILTATFGDIPYYTEDVSSLEVLDKISKIGRMPAIATRTALIDELQKSVLSLPLKRTSDVTDNRISAPMAYMLIAKMSMWNKDYTTALTALKEVQKIYGQLVQYPLTDTYFRNKNTPESIFEVQFTWAALGLKKTTTVSAFFMPTKASGTSTYDGVNIPELGSKANPFASITPSKYFVSLYDVYDPRREIILAYTYNGAYFKRPMANNGTGKPWMGPKFWCPEMDNIADGNNQKVFRYADALLMIAECANELDDPITAMSAINEVKGRASQDYVLASYPGKTEFFTEVKEERARELMGEYGRKWDLVRWGIFYDAVKATTATEYVSIEENLRPYHEYYPISDGEISRSWGNLTNPAYK